MRRPRHQNMGLRKRCDCPRKVWPKCPHSWFVNFKPRGGTHHRLSLDRELGRHVESKREAETEATKIRAAILVGTFRAPTSMAGPVLTFDDVAARYLENVQARLRPRTAEQVGYHLIALVVRKSLSRAGGSCAWETSRLTPSRRPTSKQCVPLGAHGGSSEPTAYWNGYGISLTGPSRKVPSTPRHSNAPA